MKLFAILYKEYRTAEIYESGKGVCIMFYDTDFLSDGTRNNEERFYFSEMTVFEAMDEAIYNGWKEGF